MNGTIDSINNSSIFAQATNLANSSLPENENKVATTEIDKQISTIFKLSIPFHSKETVDILNEYDAYSQASFQELIQEQEYNKFPYFLALVKDNAGRIENLDGSAFIRSYFKYNHKTSPTTRRPIKEAQIYQIDHLKDQAFTYLGNLSSLRENKDHLIKFINACDPNLNPFYRGQERYYMGNAFEKGVKKSTEDWLVKPDLKKSFFWYNKSKEDRYFGGPIALAAWYAQGNQEVQRSNELFFQNLKLAADWVPTHHPQASLIYQDMCQFYDEIGKTLCSEDEMKKYRNLLKKQN